MGWVSRAPASTSGQQPASPFTTRPTGSVVGESGGWGRSNAVGRGGLGTTRSQHNGERQNQGGQGNQSTQQFRKGIQARTVGILSGISLGILATLVLSDRDRDRIGAAGGSSQGLGKSGSTVHGVWRGLGPGPRFNRGAIGCWIVALIRTAWLAWIRPPGATGGCWARGGSPRGRLAHPVDPTGCGWLVTHPGSSPAIVGWLWRGNSAPPRSLP